jgi:ribosome-associated heat shock protein Hsp15
MDSGEAPRIDKWLWAVRVFKTRSMATQACKAGKVKVDELAVKPSREVRREMIISVHNGPITRTLKVLELLHNRVGAKLVNEYMLDLTPPEEYAKLELIRQQPFRRDRGAGRPTKKERRDMDTWMDWD